MNLKEATHTYASYDFSTYCEQVNKDKRKKYFSENFEATSKYYAFGPSNGCDGDCEGTGWVPVYKDDMSDPYRKMWVQAELDSPAEDGWHFVPCPKCSKTESGHIVKEGSKFVLKHQGEKLSEFVREAVEEPHKKPEPSKHNPDKKKDAEDKRDADPNRKQDAKERHKEKQKAREQKKLMPYEFSSQKEADRASSHLGLHGSHTIGNGIYKPGSSEFALRDAVHRKKQKQKMKGGKLFHSEEAEGLSTGTGIAMPDVIMTFKNVLRRKE